MRNIVLKRLSGFRLLNDYFPQYKFIVNKKQKKSILIGHCMNKTIIVSNYVLFTVHTIFRRLIENWILQNNKKKAQNKQFLTIVSIPCRLLSFVQVF